MGSKRRQDSRDRRRAMQRSLETFKLPHRSRPNRSCASGRFAPLGVEVRAGRVAARSPSLARLVALQQHTGHQLRGARRGQATGESASSHRVEAADGEDRQQSSDWSWHERPKFAPIRGRSGMRQDRTRSVWQTSTNPWATKQTRPWSYPLASRSGRLPIRRSEPPASDSRRSIRRWTARRRFRPDRNAAASDSRLSGSKLLAVR